jgi:hypothetical protein
VSFLKFQKPYFKTILGGHNSGRGDEHHGGHGGGEGSHQQQHGFGGEQGEHHYGTKYFTDDLNFQMLDFIVTFFHFLVFVT